MQKPRINKTTQSAGTELPEDVLKIARVRIGNITIGFASMKRRTSFIETTEFAKRQRWQLLTTEMVEGITKDKAQYKQLYDAINEFGWAWMDDARPIQDSEFDANGVYRWAGPGPRALGIDMGRGGALYIGSAVPDSRALTVAFVAKLHTDIETGYSQADNAIPIANDQEGSKRILSEWWTPSRQMAKQL